MFRAARSWGVAGVKWYSRKQGRFIGRAAMRGLDAGSASLEARSRKIVLAVMLGFTASDVDVEDSDSS